MPNQSLAITTDAHDGFENAFAYNASSDHYMEDSGAGYGGYSFILTADIPDGSTIDFCYISLNNLGDNSGEITIGFYVEASAVPHADFDNSAHHPTDVIGAAYGPVSTGARTYSSGAYFGSGETGETNLASILQSLVDDQSGLSSGDQINLIGTVTAGTGYAQFEDFSNAGSSPAELYIEWTEGGGGAARHSLTLLGVG